MFSPRADRILEVTAFHSLNRKAVIFHFVGIKFSLVEIVVHPYLGIGYLYAKMKLIVINGQCVFGSTLLSRISYNL